MDDGLDKVHEYYRNMWLLEELFRQVETQQRVGFYGELR